MAHPTLTTLALDVQSEVERLRDVLAAFVGLEKLVASREPGDGRELELDCRELGSMLQFLNEGLERQIENLDHCSQSMLGAVN